MSETITFDTRAFVAQVQQLGAEMGAAALGQATDAGALVIQKRARIAMAQPKSGMSYSRGGRAHVASAPGEAPAIDTGNLTNSLQVKRLSATQQSAESACFTNAEYAAMLEYGTRRMAGRPFLRPAMDEGKAEIEAVIVVTLQRAINRAVSK